MHTQESIFIASPCFIIVYWYMRCAIQAGTHKQTHAHADTYDRTLHTLVEILIVSNTHTQITHKQFVRRFQCAWTNVLLRYLFVWLPSSAAMHTHICGMRHLHINIYDVGNKNSTIWNDNEWPRESLTERKREKHRHKRVLPNFGWTKMRNTFHEFHVFCCLFLILSLWLMIAFVVWMCWFWFWIAGMQMMQSFARNVLCFFYLCTKRMGEWALCMHNPSIVVAHRAGWNISKMCRLYFMTVPMCL